MNLNTNIGQIYKFNPQKFEGDIFLYAGKHQDSNIQTLIIAEIKHAPRAKIKMIFKTLVETFCTEYPTPLQSLTAEERLAEVNYALARLLNKSSQNITQNISLVLVEINGDILSVATLGGGSVFMIRDKKMIPVKPTVAKSLHDKIIPNFITGQILKGDILIMALKSLFNHLSTDRIIGIVNKQSGQTAADTILSNIKSLTTEKEPVLGLVVNFS